MINSQDSQIPKNKEPKDSQSTTQSIDSQGIMLSIEENPTACDLESFWQILIDYNRSKAGIAKHEKLNILLRDDEGKVMGGLNGVISRGWLFVENLAIKESHRSMGLGATLLKAAEEESIKRGCKAAYLDTFSFQALPFYQKQGYSIFGTLPDFPEGHSKYFLWKKLESVAAKTI